ncbi:SGNH/GDSL hydrolase family protein [Actinomycetospora straminea]|uniref:SGNH/GDSL hydrolase family protein n=1 Tax=Actinomycetospora straminea TaxID=663607 RepID=A0ABP9F4E1_9PSEU|nr:SGNH/GDSL hydrolase family protein [Actinomycetospora straminea]MDD7934717.1 SGNH/GDSL hydrolase family protein [Actinomycetospora straminea]
MEGTPGIALDAVGHRGGRRSWRRFVALGDSFTEGVGDPDPATGRERGWADRLAGALARADPDVRYANLAVRGLLLDRVVATQVPEAVRMAPDLVSLCAAGNDLLRPAADPAALAERFEGAVATLRATGADVLVFTGFDTRESPLLNLVGRRLAAMNDHIREIAHRQGAHLVDLWVMPPLADPRARTGDRLHLDPAGHARVAARACEVLGLPTDVDWHAPWPPAARTGWGHRRAEDARWARDHLWPWVQRRAQGRSTGDDRRPKRPDLAPVIP